MKLDRLAFSALALTLGTSVLFIAQSGMAQVSIQLGSGQDRAGWDAPPQEFRDIQRQGFHDGIEAGRRDYESHRPPNVDATMEFRRPPVPDPARDEYREGFRRGYDMAFSHFREGMGAVPMPMTQNGPAQDRPPQGYGQDHPDHDQGGWDAPPQEFRDVQRRGFHDGIEAGRRDFESHRPPNVERNAEFRRPPVPPPARDEYREGFRRGYDSFFSHLREDRGHRGDDQDRH